MGKDRKTYRIRETSPKPIFVPFWLPLKLCNLAKDAVIRCGMGEGSAFFWKEENFRKEDGSRNQWEDYATCQVLSFHGISKKVGNEIQINLWTLCIHWETKSRSLFINHWKSPPWLIDFLRFNAPLESGSSNPKYFYFPFWETRWVELMPPSPFEKERREALTIHICDSLAGASSRGPAIIPSYRGCLQSSHRMAVLPSPNIAPWFCGKSVL